MTEKAANDIKSICQIINDAIEIEKIYLFGSHVYGTPNKNSDYDLCVIIPDGALRPVDAAKQIRQALYAWQSLPLDVIVYRASNFRQRTHVASLERRIAREGMLLHEQRRA